MTDFIYEEAFEPDVNIKVIGVGGGGGNALNCMVDATDVSDIEYVTINTDAKALKNSKAATRIQIGAKLTKGRGAGNKPEIGQHSAEENIEEIEAALKGADMVFITAGMGGGTGTGAAPVVAKAAQQMGILTVAVVTKPFAFEREQKMRQAEAGIAELQKYVDSLIVIPNEKLLAGLEKAPTMKESFALSDDILKTGVKSISDLIVEEGYINLDFADVSTTMKGAGYAHMAIGHGSGKDKAMEAAKAVISSPLLETSIAGARRLLINIAMSEDTLASDVDTASKMITEAASPDVQFIFGAAFKEDMQDEMTVTVIAADFSNGEESAPEPEEEPAPRFAPKPASKPVSKPKKEAVPVVIEEETEEEPEEIAPEIEEDDEAEEIPVRSAPQEQSNSYMPRPSGHQRKPSVNDMDMQEIFDILGGN
ncbi:MAG: cell division protein FtsZ [Oscillospiraceae bacterium]|nr:cell division protein FtsZ [Oscillospiraceae bacterium]